MKNGHIYIIEVISGNKDKIGYKYVGRSINVKERRCSHFRGLLKNVHDSKRLQRYYNKYGKDSLKFSILIECPENELNFWEKWWIKCFDSRINGFNSTDGGYEANHSKKQCTLKNIFTGELVTCDSYIDFSRKYNLERGCVSAVCRGKQNTIGDWYNPNGEWKPNFKKVIDPSGKEHEILQNRMSEFCSKNGLNVVSFYSLMYGKVKYLKGWVLPENAHLCGKELRKEYKLVSPDGKIYEGKCIRDFCKEMNLHEHVIASVVSGKAGQYKGWTKYKE